MEGIGKLGSKIALVEKKSLWEASRGTIPSNTPVGRSPPNPPKKFGLTVNKVYVYVYVY